MIAVKDKIWFLREGLFAKYVMALVGLVVFVLLCASAALGMFVRPRLPEQHRSRETTELMQITIGQRRRSSGGSACSRVGSLPARRAWPCLRACAGAAD